MLIKFTKSTDFEDRHYSRGDVREFDAVTAKKLIDEGVAVVPAVPTEKAKTVAVELETARLFEPNSTKTVTVHKKPTGK